MQPTAYAAFHVTGTDTNGRRFKRVYAGNEYFYAFGINLYRGTVWGVDASGKRKALKRVFN